MKIITSLTIVLLLTHAYALTHLTHEQAAASTTTASTLTVTPVAPNPTATAGAPTGPTENDLSAAEKEDLIKWRSNLIPWAKVKGKDRCVSHVQG
jgi:hypothetical protein